MAEKALAGIIYECVRCGAKVSAEDIEKRGEVQCPECRYRVLKKIRPPIIKRVKAV